MTTDQAPLAGPTIDRIGECRVLRDVSAQPGIDTVEGRMVPLMAGSGIRTHVIEMFAGQYCHPHPHPTESLIYTISGRWVFCTTENDQEVRTVINAGDLFHFVADVPTGFEVPFDETAVILILKGEAVSYEDMWAGISKARDSMAKDAEGGEPFTYDKLEPNHAARVFGAEVSGADPALLNSK